MELSKTLEPFFQWEEIPNQSLLVDLACQLYLPGDNERQAETKTA